MGAASRMMSGQITRQITRWRTSMRFDPGTLGVDLGSEDGNDILPGPAAVFLGGFVGQVGFHVHATQGSKERSGRFRGDGFSWACH